MTSAAEMDEEEDDGGCLIMGLSALGEERPEPLLGVPPGRVGVGGVGEGERGGGDPLPRLFELADELGGQGASGLRWSQLTVFDDQVGVCVGSVACVFCFCGVVWRREWLRVALLKVL